LGSGHAFFCPRGPHQCDLHGAYVFWIRAPGGSEIPWYIGLAKETSLGGESTSKDKLRKYALAMMQRTGKPGLTFVAAEKKSGAIDHLETFLIWVAQHRTEALLNQRKISTSPLSVISLLEGLEIPGVVNSTSGKPSTAAVKFKAMMGL
jgi:hypothetical protein